MAQDRARDQVWSAGVGDGLGLGSCGVGKGLLQRIGSSQPWALDVCDA